jgi:hypothetical protein
VTIQNTFEFTNLQELRRRVKTAIEVGRRNLTGAEYDQWVPSMERKLQAIDSDVEDFFVRQAFGSKETTSTVLYASYCAGTGTTVRVQTNVLSGGSVPVNVLTGVPPETITPCLPFGGRSWDIR